MSTPKNIESTLHEEELTQLRRQASEKENQVSRVKGELWKKNNELQQLREASNETMAKLRAELNRVMELESDLNRLNEDLRSERFSRENLESALKSVKEKLCSEEQEKRHLELELENYTSRTSSQHQQDLKRLLLEKQNLESRLKTAEARLREERLSHSSKSNSSSEPVQTDIESQRYINELQDKLSTAHKDLAEASRLLSITRKEADKTNRFQNELIAAHNARMQAENLLKGERAELDSIRERLEDQEEELNYWRSTFGDKSEEEDHMTGILQGCDGVKKELAESKARELALSRRLETMEARQTDLVMEKEEALNELDRLKELYQGAPAGHSADADGLRQLLREKDTALQKSREYANELQQIYKETLAACDVAEARVEELEKQIQSSKPDPPPLIVVSPPPSKTVPRKPFLAQPTHEMTPQDEAAILRLLTAVDRLRSERDSLRRAVHFTSVEHRISLETVQGQLAEKSKEVTTLQVELETLRQHLDDATTETTSELLKLKDEAEIWRTRCETLESERQDVFRTNDTDLQIMRTHLEDIETSYRRSSRALEKSSRLGLAAFVLVQHLSSQVHALPNSLEEDEKRRLEVTQERDELRTANETLCSEVATLEAQLGDVKRERDAQNDRISNLHSEIQDLNIQVSNLQYEVKEGKEELLSAQGGAVSEHIRDERDPAVLLSRILTLEQRVARRTEQIGTLQHDSKRLETNLRLAEETIMELTGDLEDIKRERACLVDDCAQARKERDNIQRQLEEAEVEVDTLLNVQQNQSVLEEHAQAEIANHTRTIESLVGLIFDSKAKLRRLGSSHVGVSSRLKVLKEQSTALEGRYAHSLAENERLALRIESMEVTLVQQTDEVDKWKQDLNSAQAETASLLNNLQELKAQKKGFESRMSQQSHDQLAALESLRIELADARETLASTERELELVRKDGENSRQLLESLQADDSDRTAEVKRLSSITRELQATIEEQTTAYRSELASLKQSFDNERSQLRGELETTSALREEYGAKIRDLEEKLVAMESLKQAAESAKQHCEAEILALKTRIEEETTDKLELEAGLRGSSDKVTELENHIAAAVSHYESEVRDLKALLSEGQSQIDEQTNIVSSLKREKNAWELEQVRLEAELERASTKYQYAEQQLKNSERELHTLEKDVQHLRAQATKFEEAAQDAETALISQTNLFEQKLAVMQRELEKRVNHRQCEETIGEFREKIEYLEEVLQMKSAELEENDDRIIEALKDNKRLQSKVESLDRKYRGLQTKSASLVAKNEALSHENGELRAKLDKLNRVAVDSRKKLEEPVVTSKAAFETDPQPRAANSNLPRPKSPSPDSSTPIFRPPTRIPSSPAAVLRARTPDPDRSRKFAAPVPSLPELPPIPPFMVQQARAKLIPSQTAPDLQSACVNTPPSMAQPESNAHSSSGRKRRLPEDFDSPARIPVQAIFAPAPSERSTPSRQCRKLLGKDTKGFAPTSRKNTSQLVSSPLPQRAALGETTNSPRDAIRSLGLGKPSITSNTAPSGGTKATSNKSWLSKSRMVLSKDGRSVTVSGTGRRS